MKTLFLLMSMAVFAISGCTSSLSSNSSGSEDTDILSNTCYRSSADTSYLLICAPSFDGGTPGWISTNFKCGSVVVSGGDYVFTVTSRPMHKSKYWGVASPNFENSMPTGTYSNPNTIATQNYVVNIPSVPALLSSPAASSYDIVGITADGVAIFNNQAAPGDSLAAELETMDYGNGHPTGAGVYHYHIEPCYLTNNDNSFVGVMRDGYPIFGRKEPVTGADPVYVDSCTYSNATSVANCRPYPTQLPNFHCHTIATWTGPSCHYHVTNTDPYIIEYYAGSAGIYTN